MTISFSITSDPCIRGLLCYIDEDHAFKFTPDPEICLQAKVYEMTSLVLNTIQIEIDLRAGRLLYAWGYSPKSSWQDSELILPPIKNGSVVCMVIPSLVENCAKAYGEAAAWHSFYDSTKQIFVIRSEIVSERAIGVEFADGCIAEILDDRLVGLWLLPS